MEKPPKKPSKYFCGTCSFNTSNKKDYNRHLSTQKHIIRVEGDDVEIKNPKKNPTIYTCECGQLYSVPGSLWRHKKKCSNESKPENTIVFQDGQPSITPEVVMEIMKQNKDIQNLLIEQNNKLIEKITEMTTTQNNTITNSNNNSNNSFNLNFFLNEQCKNAINLVDFIDSLKVSVEDLARTGQLGYVEGISQIFLNGLKELDVYNRPIHCTDLKRETVYVRDQDKWEKENEEKTKLNEAVKKITVKNLKQLPKWEEANPEFSNFTSKKNDEYMAISKSSLGGYDSDEDKRYKESIIRNVLKNTKIGKGNQGSLDVV